MKHIAISGPVAAGKTTLLERLRTALGERAAFHEEKPQNNPFIREYYSDSTRWSFHSQITFLALYFDDLQTENDSWLNDCREFYIYDRSLSENLVIARYRLEQGDVTQTEYDIIEKTALGIEKLMPQIDKYIYLDASVPLQVERLRQRGRGYESELGVRYATDLKRIYDAWAAGLPQDRLLRVNCDRGVDLDEVIRFIES